MSQSTYVLNLTFHKIDQMENKKSGFEIHLKIYVHRPYKGQYLDTYFASFFLYRDFRVPTLKLTFTMQMNVFKLMLISLELFKDYFKNLCNHFMVFKSSAINTEHIQ